MLLSGRLILAMCLAAPLCPGQERFIGDGPRGDIRVRQLVLGQETLRGLGQLVHLEAVLCCALLIFFQLERARFDLSSGRQPVSLDDVPAGLHDARVLLQDFERRVGLPHILKIGADYEKAVNVLDELEKCHKTLWNAGRVMETAQAFARLLDKKKDTEFRNEAMRLALSNPPRSDDSAAGAKVEQKDKNKQRRRKRNREKDRGFVVSILDIWLRSNRLGPAPRGELKSTIREFWKREDDVERAKLSLQRLQATLAVLSPRSLISVFAFLTDDEIKPASRATLNELDRVLRARVASRRKSIQRPIPNPADLRKRKRELIDLLGKLEPEFKTPGLSLRMRRDLEQLLNGTGASSFDSVKTWIRRLKWSPVIRDLSRNEDRLREFEKRANELRRDIDQLRRFRKSFLQEKIVASLQLSRELLDDADAAQEMLHGRKILLRPISPNAAAETSFVFPGDDLDAVARTLGSYRVFFSDELDRFWRKDGTWWEGVLALGIVVLHEVGHTYERPGDLAVLHGDQNHPSIYRKQWLVARLFKKHSLALWRIAPGPPIGRERWDDLVRRAWSFAKSSRYRFYIHWLGEVKEHREEDRKDRALQDRLNKQGLLEKTRRQWDELVKRAKAGSKGETADPLEIVTK